MIVSSPHVASAWRRCCRPQYDGRCETGTVGALPCRTPPLARTPQSPHHDGREVGMKRLAVVLALGVACVGQVAAAADWPTRPIRIIAPSTAGGAADMFARLLCDQFSETFRERCFVENRAGAGGLIGTAATAQAAPDGYTLTTSSTAYHVIAPVVSPNPGFDP